MKKKTYADLFKPQKDMALIVEQRESISENGSGSSLGASWSSGLSTPLGSELGSSGTSGSEDEEFMAELSRQMAECMLNEEEDHAEDHNTDTGSCVCDGFQVYQLNNQPEESGVGERRVKGNKRVEKTGRNYVNYRRNGLGIGEPGMKAIFLDNSGSSYGSGGTGVFLPRFPKDPTLEKKKPDMMKLIRSKLLTICKGYSEVRIGIWHIVVEGTRRDWKNWDVLAVANFNHITIWIMEEYLIH